MRTTRLKDREALETMLKLRMEGKTFGKIGRHFNVTGECIRLHLKGMPRPKPIRFPVPGFRAAMYRHLYALGIGRCRYCRLWKSDVKHKQCGDCNKARVKEWRRENRERHNDWQREWRRKNREAASGTLINCLEAGEKVSPASPSDY